MEHGFHFSDSLVPGDGVTEFSVNGPDLLHVRAIRHLAHLLVGDGCQVLHHSVPLDATGGGLLGGRDGDAGPLVTEESHPNSWRGEFDDDGRWRWWRRRRLARDGGLGASTSTALDTVGLRDGVCQRWHRLELFVGLSCHQDRFYNSIVDPLGEGPGRVTTAILLLANAEAKEPHSITARKLVPVVILLLELKDLLVEGGHSR